MTAMEFVEMAHPDANINDARKLEENRFMQWASESARQRDIDIKSLERHLAAKGGLMGGGRLKEELEIMFSSIESLVDKAIMCRQELGGKVPVLLTPDELRKLQDKLNQCVDSGVAAMRTRSTLQAMGGGVTKALIQRAEQRATSIKAILNRKLEALPLEARLGMHQPVESRMTLNISNSTIANLNLGNVMGDLNGSIQHLNADGHSELAEEFKKITEAIAASQDLSNETRKELLEHLAVVSEEAAKPAETRKMGPVKTSFEAIKTGISMATQLMTLWPVFEHALKTNGIIR